MPTKHFFLLLFTTIFVLFSSVLYAQNIEVSGVVVDKGTGKPIPYAHVYVQGTQIGTTSNENGNFLLKHKRVQSVDTLVFSSLGYFSYKKPVKGSAYLTIALEPELHMMAEVTVTPGKNPAIAIMEKIISQKEKNNPSNLDNYSSEEYSKIRFDLNHFTEKIKNNILVKPFDYIWDNTDTTADGVTFLPILLIEKYSEHYYRKSPFKNKSIVQAKNIIGLPGRKIIAFADDLYFTPNMYEDFVVILEKNFPSPLNKNFNLHYNYYADSAGVGSDKTYNLVFQPKLKRSLAFVGEMSVDAESYALKSITLRFDIKANVNFVRSYLVEQKYEEVQNGNWMLSESNVIGDFTVIENASDLTGFFGRKRSKFTNYKINNAKYKEIYNGVSLVDEVKNASAKDEDYWVAHRSEDLNPQEVQVKEMTERIENDPKFILRKNIIYGFTTGFIPWEPFDVGDFYTFYSQNYIEDSRVKLGFRTNPELEFPLSGSIYGAYGFADEQWKYGISTVLRLDKKNKTRLGASYKYDIIQLGRSVNTLAIDNILTSIFQIGDVTSRVYEQEFSAYAEHIISNGLIARAGYFFNELSPTDTVKFRETDLNEIEIIQPKYKSAGIDVVLKFNWQNDDINGDFYSKEDLKKHFRKLPDFAINWQFADEALGSELNYQKLSAYLSQFIRTRNLGYSQYHIEAGITDGIVPYTHLNTPFSNQLVLYDDMAFNLMKYLEFLADQYVTINVQHHFDGAILDKIPLVNHLKWRSFVFLKGYWGSMSDKNLNSEYILPSTSSAISQPYFEVGFGFENIFKIARIDFVWRINDTTLPDSYKFIIKPSFSFSF